MSELLQSMRLDYDDLLFRQKHGEPWLKARALTAYNRWFRQACVENRHPDNLDQWIDDEYERFLSRTVPGVDGHIYWYIDNRDFTRNDGRVRKPARWWWEHVHGPISVRDLVKPTCGDTSCIAIDHVELLTLSSRTMYWTHERIAAVLQVAQMKLGRVPTMRDFESLDIDPSTATIRARFGSWGNALEAAGMEFIKNDTITLKKEDCLEGIRLVASIIHGPPSKADIARHREALVEAGLPRNKRTYMRLCGSGNEWVASVIEALAKHNGG